MTRTWPAVPDPRDEACPAGRLCEVCLEDHRWSHLHEHVSDLTEPWDDWLTPPLASAFRSSVQVGVSEADRQATRQQVSDRMEQAAKQSLAVPLAVLYEVAQPPSPTGKGSPWELTVDLVLPCGAKLCLREGRNKVLGVRSCYFLNAVRSAPEDRRWRLLMFKLLDRYATDNGNSTFSPPDPSAWPKPNPETGEYINRPRFQTEARWGVDGALVDPWNNVPDYWASPPPPSAPPPPLGPRQTY